MLIIIATNHRSKFVSKCQSISSSHRHCQQKQREEEERANVGWPARCLRLWPDVCLSPSWRRKTQTGSYLMRRVGWVWISRFQIDPARLTMGGDERDWCSQYGAPPDWRTLETGVTYMVENIEPLHHMCTVPPIQPYCTPYQPKMPWICKQSPKQQ